jgi:hypothetical protein
MSLTEKFSIEFYLKIFINSCFIKRKGRTSHMAHSCLRIWVTCWAQVAHACNPGCSEDRDQDCSSKPAQANSLRDPIWNIPNTEKGWWSGLMCRS